MPTFVYCIVNKDGSLSKEIVEISHESGEVLEVHPETGQQLKKIPSGFNIGGGSKNALGSSGTAQYAKGEHVASILEVDGLLAESDGEPVGFVGKVHEFYKKGHRLPDGPLDMSAN